MNDTGFKFEELPGELQIYILSRLPPKQLSRCKCVSKHWNTTLTILAFLFTHSLSYDKHSKLAFVAHMTIKGYNSVLSFELSDNITPNRPTMTVPKTIKMSVKRNRTTEITTEEVIIGNHECFTNYSLCHHQCNNYNLLSNICNDLICLFGLLSPRVGLFNLKTQDFIHLPAVNIMDAGCCRYWYALGFDPVSKVYKVLCIYGGTKVCSTKAAIFTLESSKHWKPVEYKFLRPAVTMNWRYWRLKNMFCLDGVIYRVNRNEFLGDGDTVLTVLAFDLNREVFTDYKLVLIPFQDAETIRYYLTSLKGNPTLFIWKTSSDEIEQLTLFNHKHPKAAWNTRIFTAPDFPKNFPYGSWGKCVAGGSILLQHVKPFKNSRLSCYKWYDLENFAID